MSEESTDRIALEITSNVCRICLQDNSILKSLFHCSIDSHTYAEIYKLCSGFEIKNDDTELPTKVCESCEKLLLEFYNFQQNIKQVEMYLEEFKKQSNAASKKRTITEEFLDESEMLLVVEKVELNDEDFTIESIYEDDQIFIEEDAFEEESQDFHDDDDDTINSANPIEEIELTEENEEEHCIEEQKECIEGECMFERRENERRFVRCLTCEENCEMETHINSIRPDEAYSIRCKCNSVLKNRRSFLKHFISLHSNKEFKIKCRMCSETFSNFRSRLTHEAHAHGMGYNYICEICDRKFYRSDHCKDHKKICGNTVSTKIKIYSCEVCLVQFQREDAYERHLKSAHVDLLPEETEEVRRRAEEYADTLASRSRDNYLFDDSDAALESAIQPHGLTCSDCPKIFKNTASLNKHKKVFHTGNSLQCDYCPAEFQHRTTKLSHMAREHGSAKTYMCTVQGCNFGCFKRDRFVAHVAKHDDPDKLYSCPICQQQFKSYATMTLHKAKHTRIQYQCNECFKTFMSKQSLNIHVRLHNREGLFQCPVCNNGFTRKSHLNSHQMRKNHFVENQE